VCALFEVLGPGDDVAAGVEPRVIDPVFERRERRAVGVEAFLLVLELEGGVGGIVVSLVDGVSVPTGAWRIGGEVIMALFPEDGIVLKKFFASRC